MAVSLRQSRRFSAADPVTRYWIANSVGFAVSGHGHGTVERVIAEDDPYEPTLLEVRTRHKRVRRVPTSEVVGVIPGERLLVLDEDGRGSLSLRDVAENEQLRHGLALARHVLHAAGILLLIGIARGWELACAGWRVARPVLVRAARRAWSESVRLVASVPWQRYGRSARSATTRLWQAQLTPSSPRRTTSSETRSARSSEDRARRTSST